MAVLEYAYNPKVYKALSPWVLMKNKRLIEDLRYINGGGIL